MKALILCNGEAPSADIFRTIRNEVELFIACDGAAQLAISYSYMPDIIIGDLDSLDLSLTQLACVKHVADQQTNDLSKALIYAQQQGATEVIILGASGLRFDHFLGNLYILPNFCEYMRIKLIDNYGTAFIAARREIIEAPLRSPLSLFALGAKPVLNLNSEGLEYSLKNATLMPHSAGASLNYLCAPEARITHDSGILLIYVASRL